MQVLESKDARENLKKNRTENMKKKRGKKDMEKLIYVDRRNTNCNKWDGQYKMFGEEGLHAMWVADMDFRVPECVVEALKNM